MANKTVKTRIQQKRGSESDWTTAGANGFKPLDGEIIIYQKDENHDQERIKIGNDIDTVDKLPFWQGGKGDKGDDGREVEFNVSATHIQWRYKGDSTWTNLVALADIKGGSGPTGNGISSINKTSTNGLVDTYTITFTNGSTKTFTVTNGSNGATGNGIKEIKKISTSGLVDTYRITYTNNNTFDFTVTNGARGEDGTDGDDGVSITNAEINATGELVLTFSNNTTKNVGKVVGKDGEDGTSITGPAGRGIKSISKTSTSGLVDTYTITYSDNTTSTFNITNGRDGDKQNHQHDSIQTVSDDTLQFFVGTQAEYEALENNEGVFAIIEDDPWVDNLNTMADAIEALNTKAKEGTIKTTSRNGSTFYFVASSDASGTDNDLLIKRSTIMADVNDYIHAKGFNATSDARLKENFVEYNSNKSILDLPVYTFDFIDGAKNQIGCMAQDLQEICPEIVVENDNGYLAIQESKIVYLLLEEIKHLKARLDKLEGGK